MALSNIFTPEVTSEVINRINKIEPTTKPQWGKMNASKVMSHLCVSYEMAFEDIHKKPNAFVKFLLKSFVKKGVVNENPYPINSRTAPAFIIVEEKDFETEKARLINYIKKTQELGSTYFDNKESNSFGNLTTQEWNNLFYKHLDHHLKQFGV